MMPQNTLSTDVIEASYLTPRNIGYQKLKNYERGGNNIGDASAGLRTKIWTGEYIGNQIVLSATGVTPVAVLTVNNLTEFQFTFDQNMRLFITYMVSETTAFYYWFDTIGGAYTTTQLPAGSFSPRCSLDDKRALENQVSDVLLLYLRAGGLYYRQQRDRYLIERLLQSGITVDALLNVGMNRRYRFQVGLPGYPTHTYNFSW